MCSLSCPAPPSSSDSRPTSLDCKYVAGLGLNQQMRGTSTQLLRFGEPPSRTVPFHVGTSGVVSGRLGKGGRRRSSPLPQRDIFARGDSNSVKSSMECSVVSIAKTVIMRKRKKIHFQYSTLFVCMEKLSISHLITYTIRAVDAIYVCMLIR